ncbi:RmlC-like cupin [Lentithecium fluviatile CBS 122367]|uniref:RmlC-like cupin n=1 Tax=Lentithecium fluviatile CBS 122367 TaxID=1168545 RepID=A0A6G1J5F8_9PLEO|nr:RmlC-like cupin [Lentithecium fluviatile CBS 122367]
MTPRIQPVVLSPQSIANAPAEGFAPGTPAGNVTWKTLLSAPGTPSNTLTSGIAMCAPKGGHLKCHRHTHPEMYYIISGRGIMEIDGEEHRVEKSAVVFIPGGAEHGIRNEDEEEELRWLYVFAAGGFEEIVYRFSDNGSKPRAKL